MRLRFQFEDNIELSEDIEHGVGNVDKLLGHLLRASCRYAERTNGIVNKCN